MSAFMMQILSLLVPAAGQIKQSAIHLDYLSAIGGCNVWNQCHSSAMYLYCICVVCLAMVQMASFDSAIVGVSAITKHAKHNPIFADNVTQVAPYEIKPRSQLSVTKISTAKSSDI